MGGWVGGLTDSFIHSFINLPTQPKAKPKAHPPTHPPTHSFSYLDRRAPSLIQDGWISHHLKPHLYTNECMNE